MPFDIPTLEDHVKQIDADMQIALGLLEIPARHSMLGILSKTLGGATHMLYGYLAYLSKQVIVDTCETDYLERWSRVWGINRKPATTATGFVLFEGLPDAMIPKDTLLQREDGIFFSTIELCRINQDGKGTVGITAKSDGKKSNAPENTPLALISPIEGIHSSCKVLGSGIEGGVDAESDTSLRTRLLKRIQRPPRGGAITDYEHWALSVAGVEHVWVYPNQFGLGTVGVCIAGDVDHLVLDENTRQMVQTLINEKRPITADATVFLPTLKPIDLQIKSTPNNANTQRAINNELNDLFYRNLYPHALMYVSQLNEAIQIVPEVIDHTLMTPTDNIQCEATEIPVLGATVFS